MRTAVTLYPHRVSLSKSHCICHKILVQSQCGVHIADKWDTKGAKVSPQAELVCTLEERLFSDLRSKQRQIGWHFTTGEIDSGRGALEEGGETRTDVGTTSAFLSDISQRWTTYKLPTAMTDGQPWVCSYSSPRLFPEEFSPPPYMCLSPSSSSVWHLPAVPSSLVASWVAFLWS